ncbi:MAG: radical SAM protein [Candidatus Omnitrophica bacterium]|nr:radical SAM protein [Candidatus Omnitrophota bacterium]
MFYNSFQAPRRYGMKRRIAFPEQVDIALTGKCNLRCKHCNTTETWDGRDELSFGEVKDLLDQLKEQKIFRLDLFGGEPFYHPRFFKYLELINRYPMRVTILTNGTLIDEEAVRHLKKLRFLAIIQISIDGSKPEIHDWQRGEGSFEKAMRGVRLLLSNGVPVTIKAILNSHNYTDLDNMVELARGLGLPGMHFGDAVECGKAAVYSDQMSFESEAHRKIMENVFEVKKKYPGFEIGGTLGQKIDMLKDFYKQGPGSGTRGVFSTCPAGHSTLSIRSDGKVVPCSAFWTLICGDVRKSSLKDIWENSEMLNRIRDLSDDKLAQHCSDCGKCDYMSHCNGGCRAAAYYMSNNDLRGIDPSTCLVFSNMTGTRIPREKVLSGEKGNK